MTTGGIMGASLALGRLYAGRGDVQRADAALRHASWLDVHDVESLNPMSLMRIRPNQLEDACRTPTPSCRPPAG
jgi:hypothetical protein